MESFTFTKKLIRVIHAVLLLLIIASPCALAVEQKESVQRVLLLTNRDYFPALVKAIDEAQSEIFMAFFLFKTGVNSKSYPDKVLAHLLNAAKRGVKVVVILGNTGGRDRELDSENQQTVRLLKAKGIEVFYDTPGKTMHAKLIVIDQRLILLGGHNLTEAAMKYNNEISILLDNSELAERARNFMLTIIKEAK